MSLRRLAERHLGRIMERERGGFGWPVELTDPAGTTDGGLLGIPSDISQLIDPDTGMVVSGRSATLSLRISSILSAGFTALPRGVASPLETPWLVRIAGLQGEDYLFKVTKSDPDRGMGVILIHLETIAE